MSQGSDNDSERLRVQLRAARRALSERIRSETLQSTRLAEAEAEIVRMHASPGYRLAKALHEARRSLRGLVRLPWRVAAILWTVLTRRGADPVQALPASQPPATRPRADTHVAAKPRFAAIVDEFTALSLAPEAVLCDLVPEHWRDQMEEFGPDLLFVESAWRGAGGRWRNKVAPLSPELVELLDWCERHGVPTVFWNKEDPIHFDYFAATASHFDHIYTTDADCAQRYRERLGREAKLLQFAAQPSLHHPLDSEERVDAFCFAGSYYRKYQERQRDFMRIVDYLSPRNRIVILDRNQGRNDPEFEFPPELQRYIIGNADPSEMDAAYKRYRFAINVNTVKSSSTMCARRVFDLLACNTPVVSNPSLAYESAFGADAVSVISEHGVSAGFDAMLGDETLYRKHRLVGLRAVMERHTWRDRIASLLRDLGLATPEAEPALLVAARISGPDDWAALQAIVDGQSRKPEGVFVVAGGIEHGPGRTGWRAFADADALARELASRPQVWVACLDPRHHYAANYLRDLMSATRYCRSDAIGKGAYYTAQENDPALRNAGLQYRSEAMLSPFRAMMLAGPHAGALACALSGDDRTIRGASIDEFNFCENGAAIRPQDLERLDA